MATISRVKTWVDNEVLTASDLNGEFNNIVNDYNGGITNANISASANIAASKIAGTAATQTGTETFTNKTLTAPVINVGSDAQGDVYYRNASGIFTRLVPGTSGQYLKTQGAAANPAWDTTPKIKVGTFTRDLSAAAGNVSITGVGFVPRLLQFTYGSAAASKIFSGAGAMTATDQWARFEAMEDGYESSDTSTSHGIYLSNESGTNQQAAYVSFDADGFTLAWTKAGSPTGTITIGYVAIG